MIKHVDSKFLYSLLSFSSPSLFPFLSFITPHNFLLLAKNSLRHAHRKLIKFRERNKKEIWLPVCRDQLRRLGDKAPQV